MSETTQNGQGTPYVPTREEIESRERDAQVRAKNASLEVYEQAMAVQTNFMNPNVWTQIRAMSKVFFESGAIPSAIKNEAQLVMALQAGFEMGMTPIESLHSLYPVNGSWNIWGKAVTKRLRNHGWKIEYKDESDQGCTATVTKNAEKYTETYTFDMAQKSGYTTANSNIKIGWKEGINRRLKLRYGVLSLIIKSYIPEVLGNISDIKEVAEDAVFDEPRPEATIAAKTASMPVAQAGTLAEKLAEQRAMKHAQQDHPVGGDGKPPVEAGEVEQEK